MFYPTVWANAFGIWSISTSCCNHTLHLLDRGSLCSVISQNISSLTSAVRRFKAGKPHLSLQKHNFLLFGMVPLWILMLTSFSCSTWGETGWRGGCNGYTGSPTDVVIIDFWSVHMSQKILSRGDETLKYNRAKWGGIRLRQAHGHTEEEVHVATQMDRERWKEF